MYDVIVVGAGPTGSTAAKVLAEKRLHVLLVERHKLPRYKSCSGVLDSENDGLGAALLWTGCAAVRNVYPGRKPGNDFHG